MNKIKPALSNCVELNLESLKTVVGGDGHLTDPAGVRKIIGAQMDAKMAAEARGDLSGANAFSRSAESWTRGEQKMNDERLAQRRERL